MGKIKDWVKAERVYCRRCGCHHKPPACKKGGK